MRRLVASLFRGARCNDAHLRLLSPIEAEAFRELVRTQALEMYADADVHTRFLDLRRRRARFPLDEVAQQCADMPRSEWPQAIAEFLHRTSPAAPACPVESRCNQDNPGQLMCKLTSDSDHKDSYLHPWFSGLSVGLARADSLPGEWLHDEDLVNDPAHLELMFDQACLALADYYVSGGVRHTMTVHNNVEVHTFSDKCGWAASGCLVASVVADLIAEYTDAAGTLIFTAPLNSTLLAAWVPVGAHPEAAITEIRQQAAQGARGKTRFTNDIYLWSAQGYRVVGSEGDPTFELVREGGLGSSPDQDETAPESSTAAA